MLALSIGAAPCRNTGLFQNVSLPARKCLRFVDRIEQENARALPQRGRVLDQGSTQRSKGESGSCNPPSPSIQWPPQQPGCWPQNKKRRTITYPYLMLNHIFSPFDRMERGFKREEGREKGFGRLRIPAKGDRNPHNDVGRNAVAATGGTRFGLRKKTKVGHGKGKLRS